MSLTTSTFKIPAAVFPNISLPSAEASHSHFLTVEVHNSFSLPMLISLYDSAFTCFQSSVRGSRKFFKPGLVTAPKSEEAVIYSELVRNSDKRPEGEEGSGDGDFDV